MIKILLLLQMILNEAKRRIWILILLHYKNLELIRLLPGLPLTLGTLLLAHLSSSFQSEQPIDDIPTPDEGRISYPNNNDNAHVPKIKPRAKRFKPIQEEEKPASPEPNLIIPPNNLPEAKNNWADTLAKSYKDSEEHKLLRKTRDMGAFIKWYYRQIGKNKLTKADLEVDLVNREGYRMVPDISKPLPLGVPLGHVTIQPHFFFNKDLEYLVLGDKERRSALSISNLKAAHYLDFGIEELVLSLWIESECDYDISAVYRITHWWFKQKEFYIQRHRAPLDLSAVRSHMQILSVVSLKTYERYGYAYLKKIVLRRADYKEYKISKADFRNLHPNDFIDLYLLYLQGKLNHLSKDYTIVFKPRVLIYQDRNDQKKIMRLNEVHKFSDETLTRIRDKLAFMVKDFKLFKFNKCMENRIWTKDDKKRSEDFIEVIERRLKIRRIFWNLESFVGGRLKNIDYRLINKTE
nr:hypothetical protein [Tanacetum cinerariifolium]